MSNFGSITNPASVAVKFVESAQADDLQARVNAVLADIFAASPVRVVTDITLAGAGDGHTFVVLIESALASAVNGGLPGPASVQCYLASENEALAIARGQQPLSGPLADEQLVGSAKGTRFMGLSVLGTPITFPPIPTPPVNTGKFAGFFALMPGDNAAPVAPGSPVLFPQNGPTTGAAVRSSASQFVLADTGVYEVNWQVSVDEAGQLMLDLNGSTATTANTVAGRATGTSQISNSVLISAVANDVLRVINPAGNAAALTITPHAGGAAANPVSAWLTIKRIA